MSTRKVQKRYDGDFKLKVVETMAQEHLSLRETSRQFGIGDHIVITKWERYYLTEGKEGLYKERRGRASAASGTQKGRKPKLDKKVEEDPIAEVQRLRMENAYLKKLNALVLEEERQNRKYK